MTPIENFLQTIININIWTVVKVFILIGLGLYIIFSFIVLKEVNLMNKTLKGVFNLPIKIIAWLHLVLAISVFILALIVL